MSLLHWYSAVNKEAVPKAPFENGSEGLLIMSNTVLWTGITLIFGGLKATVKQMASPTS